MGNPIANVHAKLTSQEGPPNPKTGPGMVTEIDKVTVAPDKKSIHLKVSGLTRGHVHHFNLNGVKSSSGKTLWHPDVYYTLNEIPK